VSECFGEHIGLLIDDDTAWKEHQHIVFDKEQAIFYI
jgi:hypothetical protein